MDTYLERYKQGEYQCVYNELLDLGEQIFEDVFLYRDAENVMRALMRRVRHNLENILIPRLHAIGYRFGDGLQDNPDDLSPNELVLVQQEYPIFLPPIPNVLGQLDELEQCVGTLPLSLRCWYEEVGSVNLIGSFPPSLIKIGEEFKGYKRGYPLDPLYINPLDKVLEWIRHQIYIDAWDEEPILSLSLDGDLKYGYSGSGDYGLKMPCRAIDGILLLEQHRANFADYLRLCLKRGGFPGVGEYCLLSDGVIERLTNDLRDF